jgi:hypothetical protein
VPPLWLTLRAADLPSSHYYNASGRGTPDVAALGIGFSVIVDGSFQSVGGTSARYT